MKNTKTLEALVGAFVMLGLLGLIFLAYKVSDVNRISSNDSYTIYANFNSISGLKRGASVTLAGVKIGRIESISLDKDRYEARLALAIDKRYDNIPIDSSISVLTQGLLGEKYLGLDIGADDVYFSDGDEFDFTKSAIVIERLIDQFLLKNTSGN
ncbi:MAG: outer membrane lipid asymmetry maintenance protein MlaD [Gammaproteobacteria bacterium]|nr:MAG: outer membrane lipid asymmetry maintenance protein MlaD [Gammaproteobacteria bacterium]